MGTFRWIAAVVSVAALVLGLTPAESSAVVPRTISLQAPSASTAGTTMTLRGTLTRTPKGSPVVVRRASGTRWVVVARTRTATASGSYAVAVRTPAVGATYRFRADAARTATRSAAVSPVRSVVIRVPVRASLAASNLTPVEGSAIALSGLVSPWLSGTPVVLQQRAGAATTWSTVRSIGPDSTGRFRQTVVPTSGTATRYRVSVAARGYRTGGVSAAVTVSPVAAGPAVVTGLTMSSTSRQVSLRWQNPVGTRAVVVRRAAGSIPPATTTSGTAVPVSGVASTATDSTVEPDESYTYSVFATTDAGASPPASGARPGPDLASNGWTSAVPGKVTFHWTNPAGVAQVIVEAHDAGGVPLGQTASPPPGTDIGTADRYTVGGLTSRQRVYLWVYTLDSAGSYRGVAVFGAEAINGTDTPSGPVTGVAADAAPRAVTLSWTSPASAPGSKVAIARAEGTTAPTSPTSGWVVGRTWSTETFTDEVVDSGHTYTYALWAVDDSGNYSTPVTTTVTTPAGNPPGPVTGLSATALSPSATEPGASGFHRQRVQLRWTNPPGADSVVVSRARGTTPPAKPVDRGGWSLPLPVTTMLDDDLDAGTDYSYAVSAVGTDGAYSPVATTTVRTDANQPRSVRGRVVDSQSGQPLGSAPVRFTSLDDVPPQGRKTYSTTSEPDGRYDVDLPVGTYSACVSGQSVSGGSAQGYVYSCRDVAVTTATTTSYDVPVDPAVSVRGVVRDGATGEPVAGVRVFLGRRWPEVSPVATTAADGSYVLTGISAARYPETEVATDPSLATSGTPQGYQSNASVWVATATPGAVVERDLTITPLRLVTFSGKVTAASGGAGVAGVGVHVVRDTHLRDDRPLATTAADGTWSLTTGLRTDESVRVCFDAERPAGPGSATGFSNQCVGGADFDPTPRTTTVDRRMFGVATSVSSSAQLDIALRPTVTVTGRVRSDDGSPLAGAVVSVHKPSTEITYSTTTDATGRYVLPVGVRASVWDGMVQVCSDPDGATGGPSSGGYTTPPCQERSVTSVDEPPVADFTASPAATVTGSVRDSITGEGLAGLSVTLTSTTLSTGDGIASATTTADGSFRIQRIVPQAGTTYRLCTGGVSPTCAALSDLGVTQVSVGETHRAEPLDVVPLGSVSGVVTGGDTGEPVAGVRVNLSGSRDDAWVVTDASGRYAFPRVTPGSPGPTTDATTAGPRGYRPGGRRVTVVGGTDTTADIVLEPAAALKVKVVTPDGRPAAGVLVQLPGGDSRDDVRTDEDGLATVKGIDPAIYPDYPAFEKVCAGLGGDGPGTHAGYSVGCGWRPTLTLGQTASTTVVVGLDAYFGAWVYDAATGKPIPRPTVKVTAANDQGGASAWGTDQGFGFPDHAVFPPSMGATGMNPRLPRWDEARICVQATGYRPACFRGGSADGETGPVVRSHPGLRTVATFALERETTP